MWPNQLLDTYLKKELTGELRAKGPEDTGNCGG